jgi:hypothetical protein
MGTARSYFRSIRSDDHLAEMDGWPLKPDFGLSGEGWPWFCALSRVIRHCMPDLHRANNRSPESADGRMATVVTRQRENLVQ